ncbi:MAG: hypothetical protein V7K14_29380 [Nostoc sp.]|uniref:hypothetical protein n=1 Tax=unclassified Nostoc TaxID=2593658 RepID=UPI0025F005D3|nr:hypothetical protein [Nostoc sp. NMS7]MBN3948633.1 hypothetical protein [Nostoc sp. NMS7]
MPNTIDRKKADTLVGAQQCSLRKIYMYQGLCEMVLLTAAANNRTLTDGHHYRYQD